MLAPTSSLLDLTALTDRAERLVKAARAAGADAADAVAVRSMSLATEVRDGRVEESERAEADDLGLRVLVGRRQAVVSTNDTAEKGSAALAARAVAMARAAPEDEFAGLADPGVPPGRLDPPWVRDQSPARVSIGESPGEVGRPVVRTAVVDEDLESARVVPLGGDRGEARLDVPSLVAHRDDEGDLWVRGRDHEGAA